MLEPVRWCKSAAHVSIVTCSHSGIGFWGIVAYSNDNKTVLLLGMGTTAHKIKKRRKKKRAESEVSEWERCTAQAGRRTIYPIQGLYKSELKGKKKKPNGERKKKRRHCMSGLHACFGVCLVVLFLSSVRDHLKHRSSLPIIL